MKNTKIGKISEIVEIVEYVKRGNGSTTKIIGKTIHGDIIVIYLCLFTNSEKQSDCFFVGCGEFLINEMEKNIQNKEWMEVVKI